MKTYIPPSVVRRLGFYVYLYIDPRNGRPFYVGKGKGRRVLAHLDAVGNNRKAKTIRELRRKKLEPRIEILAHNLPSEEAAFRLESTIIDLIGLKELSNQVRGWKSIESGRMTLCQLIAYYAPKPALIVHPTVLIRINRRYRHRMSPRELYEATRGVWKVNPERASKAKYALAVFEGVVREVYEIEKWNRAGTTPYKTRSREDVDAPGRWEFVGKKADESVRGRYLDHSVSRYLKKGVQTPVLYVNA
jgi:hypothetical protein